MAKKIKWHLFPDTVYIKLTSNSTECISVESYTNAKLNIFIIKNV